MNAVSLSHWGIVEYPDDLLSTNTLFLQNGEIRRWEDEKPHTAMAVINEEWPYKPLQIKTPDGWGWNYIYAEHDLQGIHMRHEWVGGL